MRVWITIFLFAALAGSSLAHASGQHVRHRQSSNPVSVDPSSPQGVDAHYVGSKTCARCHQKQARQWRSSDHAHSMMRASGTSVLGDFDHARFSVKGVITKFFRKNHGYYVRTLGADGGKHDYKVAYTFGIFPLQQYLTVMPGGRLQVLPVAWDARSKKMGGQRWFVIDPSAVAAPDDPLFWTRPAHNWNRQCAQCHSTHLQKHYDSKKHHYHTSFAQMDVSCESCHGPGSLHVEWAGKHAGKKSDGKGGNEGLVVDLRVPPYKFKHDPKTNLPSRSRPLASRTELHVCARCHSRRADLTDAPGLGHSLLQTHMPELLRDPLYYSDGQVHAEDYAWGSFLQSDMFHHGVRCSDCHNPHTLKLRAPAKNGAICLICHTAKHVGGEKHTHHKPGSPGANCIDCHMPEYTEMKVDRRRDHSLRVPRPDLSVQYGVPNACTQCHGKKSDAWAAKWTKKWYGTLKSKPPPFAQALAAGRRGEADAGRQLNAAAMRTAYPAIVRATAASMLGDHPSRQTLQTIQTLLGTDNPLLRLGAVRALQGYAPNVRWKVGVGALQDKTLAVRITAARILAPGFAAHAKGPNAQAFTHALAELFRTQRHNADRPSAHVEHGNVELSLGHADKAVAAYRSAIALQPDYAAAYVNLADLYRRQKKESKVQAILHKGLSRVPKSAAMHYALALSDLRLGEREKVLVQLQKAADLAPHNAHYVYTYGVALNSLGQPSKAIAVLKKAIRQHPGNRRLLTAIATIARDYGARKEAAYYARRLVQIAPQNQQYQQLLKSLLQGEGPSGN